MTDKKTSQDAEKEKNALEELLRSMPQPMKDAVEAMERSLRARQARRCERNRSVYKQIV